MPEVFSNTSPLQYLHQAGQLAILPALVGRIFVPPAVVAELSAGRAKGVDLPDVGNLIWVNVREPFSIPALPSMKDLGPGETEVLALALEAQDAVVLLDDAVARRAAEALGIRLRGTLGVLLDAKRAGLISAVAPILDQLQALRFRVSPRTRAAVLGLAGETP